ncbi:MAG TPA: hypothetical protein VFK97_02110 [Candidatus Saccharimonadales bacterium]|nr:hypothetical protein [Candidatus Saccharimonadales bacterium]
MSGVDQTSKDQRGIVSILVVSILTITLSLIAVGFSKLADRELRQASDRELSTQAYYAAQSGLNDAVAYLAAGGTTLTGCSDWTSVTTPVNASDYFTSDLSGGAGVAKYSCISVNNHPQVLTAEPSPGQPQVIKISATGLKNLYIAWQNHTYASSPAALGSLGQLPRQDTSLPAGATGLLRAGLYLVPAGDTSDTNDNLSSYSRVYYLYPNLGTGSPGPIPYGGGSYSITGHGPGGNNGNFVPGNCKFTPPLPNPVPSNSQAINHYCNSKITGLNGSSNTYYLYLTAQYAALDVSIQGTDAANNPVTFSGAQAVVDVTGQGTDVIQRIRATVNLTSQFNVPAYAVQSMQTLCKAFNLPLIALGQYGPAAQALDSNTDPGCAAPAGTASVTGGGTAGH